MFTLNNLEQAEAFVTYQQSLRNDFRWDNYDIVYFTASPHGMYSIDGAFRNGTWGFETRVGVSDAGTWTINPKNIRGANIVNV